MAEMSWAEQQATLRASVLNVSEIPQQIIELEQALVEVEPRLAPVREPEEQLVNDSLRGGLEKAIEDALARQAQYQTVIDATNNSINSSPASYIKTIARQGKRSERALIRLIRIVGELNESSDTGTD